MRRSGKSLPNNFAHIEVSISPWEQFYEGNCNSQLLTRAVAIVLVCRCVHPTVNDTLSTSSW